MAEAAEATRLLGNLPDEIVLLEILARLDPRSLLRCRAVRRAWRRATSTRRFLLAHHARQPSLPIVADNAHRSFLAFDHRAAAADAQFHPVARLGDSFSLELCCDGLLLLAKSGTPANRARLTVCNPLTRQHASLAPLPDDFNILGMYLHGPTCEYRLLLQWVSDSDSDSPTGENGCYVVALGSDQPPRYIGWSDPEFSSAYFQGPARVRDSLHWCLFYRPGENPLEDGEAGWKLVVFDTVAESFRQISAPVDPTKSFIFEVDGMLGIYCCNKAAEVVDIWVLPNYDTGVWDLKYRVALPIAEIRGKLEGHDGEGYWYATVASGGGDLLLLVSFGHSLFYVDTDGKLVASFQDIYTSRHRFKQTLVPHDFFTTVQGHAADASPFI
uniref:F-box domain-containing protein n=1 Tax=Hordeum vulgare subsp. vulgare TaxID=112509 RepID=A0A8I6ZDD7_HORVV